MNCKLPVSHITLLLSASTVIKQSAKLLKSVAMLSLIRDAIVKNFLLVFKKKLRKPSPRSNKQVKKKIIKLSMLCYTYLLLRIVNECLLLQNIILFDNSE